MITDDDYITIKCKLHSEVLGKSTEALGRAALEAHIADKVDPIWEQVRRDALIGTYGEYTAALFADGSSAYERLREAGDQAAKITTDFQVMDWAGGDLRFTLRLQAKWFQHPRMGLQHLVHVLCGDIFSRAASELRASIVVESVDIGRLREHFESEYRSRSNDIRTIRRLFKLDVAPLRFAKHKRADLPLLAFSLKPRNGLDTVEFRRIALGVLRAGFNIVEADVRNIDFMDSKWRKAFLEIAQQAVEIGPHVARFSMNLSGPADLAIQYAREFRDVHQGRGPWVVKVDGGLDGLSTIQALRSQFTGGDQPIITCYPILQGPLESRIGRNAFRDMLILSGADIIYPGNAPRIGQGSFVDGARAREGIDRYFEVLRQGWPMPSIAGGVHAGQLPAYLKIFGPDVCYFLGGGVALHRNGAFFDTDPVLYPRRASTKSPVIGNPITLDQAVGGSELCRFAIEAAAVTEDDGELLRVLASTQDHYVEPNEDKKPDTKYQFEPPGKFMSDNKVTPFRRKV